MLVMSDGERILNTVFQLFHKEKLKGYGYKLFRKYTEPCCSDYIKSDKINKNKKKLQARDCLNKTVYTEATLMFVHLS